MFRFFPLDLVWFGFGETDYGYASINDHFIIMITFCIPNCASTLTLYPQLCIFLVQFLHQISADPYGKIHVRSLCVINPYLLFMSRALFLLLNQLHSFCPCPELCSCCWTNSIISVHDQRYVSIVEPTPHVLFMSRGLFLLLNQLHNFCSCPELWSCCWVNSEFSVHVQRSVPVVEPTSYFLSMSRGLFLLLNQLHIFFMYRGQFLLLNQLHMFCPCPEVCSCC